MKYPKVDENRLCAVNILEISVNSDFKKKILEYIKKFIVQNKKKVIKILTIVTPNPEIVMLAQKDAKFKEILNQADIKLPDGFGLLVADRIANGRWLLANRKTIKERIPGVEFMDDLVQLADKESVRIGLIGGSSGVALKTLECLRKKYPQINGWAIDGPDVTVENGAIHIQGGIKFHSNTIGKNMVLKDDAYIRQLIRHIVSTKTGILFVGLGAPKQEYFISKLANSKYKLDVNNPLILMSVGGSFDIISGKILRAPQLIRMIGFEWLWRLVQEPWRWKRQYEIIKYIFKVLRYNKKY